jgi:hypothetical protein
MSYDCGDEPDLFSIIHLQMAQRSLHRSFKTSGFWPRVRARALRAPVFLSSLPPPNRALRASPPIAASLLLI